MTAYRLNAGTTLGPYEIRAPLGAGGMGEVYRAHDPRLDRPLALKVLALRDVAQPDTLERFIREARAASALNHPNVVTIYDVGVAAEHHYIAMELVDGAAVRELKTPQSPIEVAHLGAQIARALSVAHRAGIVHRDIKPENVVLRADGLAKVLDFGIARLMQHQNNDANMTGTGMVIGTLRYMSPEQACAESVGSASDVFSLGVMLYELLTGRHPFDEGSGNSRLLTALLTATPPNPSVNVDGLDKAWDALLADMLAKESAERPSALAVADRLDQLATGTGEATLVQSPPASAAPMLALPPVVGRTDEQDWLLGRLASAQQGRGALVTIAGEPGIGKTTLIEAFLRAARASVPTLRVLRGRCSERLAGAEAFLPILDAFEQLLATDVQAAAIATVLRRVAPTWYAQVAAPHEQDAAEARALARDQASSPERLKREFVNALDVLGRDGPLVLFLDDVHWADPSTVDLLAYLGVRLPELPMLVIASARPSELRLRRHPYAALSLELQARSIASERLLPFLGHEEVTRLVAQYFPQHAFPDTLAAIVHAKTEGNPLFVSDVLQWLRTRGFVTERDGHWQLVASMSAIEHDMPESIRSMIQRKIDQLTDGDRRLLSAASVQGADFDSAVLCALTDLAADEVEERLDTLEHVYGLVRRVDVHDLPDRTLNVRYRFVHALYQNALFATLLPTRRVTLSAKAATTLERHHGLQAEEIATTLGLLYEAARAPERAIDCYLAAARRAARMFATDESLALADRARELLTVLPDGPRAPREMVVHELRGAALGAKHGLGHPEVTDATARALALWNGLGRPVEQFTIPLAINGALIVTGQLGEAAKMANIMLSYAASTGKATLQAAAHCNAGIVSVHLGAWAQAESTLADGLRCYDQVGAEAYADFLMEPGVYMHAERARALWVLGFPDRAREEARRAIQLGEVVPHREARAFAPLFAAYVEQLCGDAHAVRTHADQILSLARERDITTILPWAMMLEGWAIAVLGEPERGLDRLRETLELQSSIGLLIDRPRFIGLEVDLLLRQAAWEEALRRVEEAQGVATGTGNCCWDSDLERQRAVALHALGAADDIIEHSLAQAAAVAERQGARSLRLRTAITAHGIWRTRGHPARERHTLYALLSAFTEGGDTADHRAAAALLG